MGKRQTYAKLWAKEKPMINTVMKLKGFRKNYYPKTAIPPYHNFQKLLQVLENAETKTAKKGYVKSSRAAMEGPHKLPTPRNSKGNYFRKKAAKPFIGPAAPAFRLAKNRPKRGASSKISNNPKGHY